MTRLLIAIAVLAIPPTATAHRLDEYLQATRVSIDVDRVDLEIDLTAGTAIASQVFAWVDTNRDGEISDAEGEAYARQMLGSVVLKVDGRTVPLQLVERAFPKLDDMKLGVGTIRLRATARVSGVGAGTHRISYLNTHRTESSVYLVNALVPGNPRITLGAMNRDRAQLGLALDYTVAAAPLSIGSFVMPAGLVMAGGLFLLFRYVLAMPRMIPTIRS